MARTQHIWIGRKTSQAAIECADQVFGKIKQDPIDVTQIVESMRTDGVTLEGLLAEIGR